MAQSPNITVFQEIDTPAPVLPTPQNPTVLIGLARQMVWRAEAGSFTGGLTNPAYEFPGLLTTATLIRHTDTTVPERLRPTVELRTAYGDVDVTANVTFSYAVLPPTFTLPSGLSKELTFQVGSTGAYSRATGKFTDSSARFVTNNVQPGATVYIDGVASLTVDVVDSETVLSVSPVDKGSGTADGDLGVLASGKRTFSSPGATFVTDGAKVGDKLRVWGYDILDSSFGAAYPATGAGLTRTLTDGDADFTAAPAVAAIAGGAGPTVAAALFDVVNILSGADRLPTFWVDALAVAPDDDTEIEVTPFAAAADPVSTDTAYSVTRLGAAKLVAVGVTDTGAWSVAGSTLTIPGAAAGFTLAVGDILCDSSAGDGGIPLFVITEIPAAFPGVPDVLVAPLFSTAAAGSPGTAGLIRPALGVLGVTVAAGGVDPDLRIVNRFAQTVNISIAAPLGAGSVTVTGNEEDGFTVAIVPAAAATVGSLATMINAAAPLGLFAHAIVSETADTVDTVVALVAVPTTGQVRVLNGGGAYTVETAGVRTLTAEGQNFETTIAPAATTFEGDERPIVYSSTGVATFYVEEVVDDETLTVRNVVAGSPAAGVSSTDFPFRIGNAASGASFGAGMGVLTVKTILSETSVEVSQDSPEGDPAAATAFTDLGYRLTLADTLSGADYEIGRTLSGADLTGTVLVKFAADRTDLSDLIRQVDNDPESPTYWETVLGFAVEDNPLALAASAYAVNTDQPFLALGVDADTVDAHTEALGILGVNDAPYASVPLTQDPEILALYPAHVTAVEEQRPQITYISHEAPGGETLVEDEAGDIGDMTVTKLLSGLITVDLTARNVSALFALGDVFTGTTAGLETFSGSITSITVPVVGTTRFTITPTSDLAVGAAQVLTDFTITARTLGLQEYAEFFAATANGIANKRVRLIFPPSFNATFTDSTAGDNAAEGEGFYGGGDIDTTLGAHFLCAIEAAKRVEFNPRIPVTKRGGAGLLKRGGLIDPLKNSATLRELLVDAGVYYLVEVAPASAAAIRAVTTSTVDLAEFLDAAVVQFDNFERLFRRVLGPIFGPHANDANFLALVSSNLSAVAAFVTKTQRSLKRIGKPKITVDKDTPDTVDIDIPVVGYADGAKGRIRMRLSVAGGA